MVVSLKGTLFYVSAACQRMLEYTEEELVNQNISMICHTGDLTGVLRQLKEAGNTAHTPIDLIFRALTKSKQKLWMEAQGQLHVEAGKGRKYVVLVGRERTVGPLSWQAIRDTGGLGKCEFWMKLSLDGMVLHATKSAADVLGLEAESIVGKMLGKMSSDADRPKILKAIRAGWNGTAVVSLAHSLTTHDGRVIECVSNFYPPRLTSSLPQTVLASDFPPTNSNRASSVGSPPVVYCQTNETHSAQRRAQVLQKSSAFNKQAPKQNISPPDSQHQFPSTPAHDGPPKSSTSSAFNINQDDISKTKEGENVFSELDVSKKTAWK